MRRATHPARTTSARRNSAFASLRRGHELLTAASHSSNFSDMSGFAGLALMTALRANSIAWSTCCLLLELNEVVQPMVNEERAAAEDPISFVCRKVRPSSPSARHRVSAEQALQHAGPGSNKLSRHLRC